MRRNGTKIIEAAITTAFLSVIVIPALLGWKLIMINLPVAVGTALISWKKMEYSLEQSKTALLWGTAITAIIIAIEIIIILNEFINNFPALFQAK